ncbi:MAG: glutamine-hydrolyzing GMP synthase [Desulfatiglandales bacterium]
MIRHDLVLILDFGSQYTQLIARRVREAEVYSEIHPFHIPLEEIKRLNPKAIILSGGPSSVYEKDAPSVDRGLFELGVPILGICYGMQLMAYLLGGKVLGAGEREYGHAEIRVLRSDPLFDGLLKGGERLSVWMSHGDRIEELPKGFYPLAETENTPYAAISDPKNRIYGVQFHPEVVHTENGMGLLKNFLFKIANLRPTWTMSSFIQTTVESIREKVGQRKVVCALSGGVDSSVTALLIHRAIGDGLRCIFVDNGLLRKDEAKTVMELFQRHLGIDVTLVDASRDFLLALKGVKDPEKKRKIIGNKFIEIFERKAKEFAHVEYLAQGTLYPDVIESVSHRGPSATIKSHHNVGGLPERMSLKLIEPLRELFKDEVRKVGIELGLPEELVFRHPFPGPGLAVRIIGEVNRRRLRILREADHIIYQEVKKSGIYRDVWQAFGVLLPIRTVGVMGDERTYEYVVAVRIVKSQDAMTADWARVDYELLKTISNRIINTVKGVNRVVYDISSKPPSTIEWE